MLNVDFQHEERTMCSTKTGKTLAALAVLFLLPATSDAFGQSVMDRERPEYDPQGIAVGSFRLHMGTELSVSSDDNVFRRPGAQDDIFYAVAPRLRLESQWGTHSLNILADLESLHYDRLSSENQTNWNLGAAGRLDISRIAAFEGAARHSRLHEPRNSPDTPGFAAEPTPYSVTHFEGVARYQPNRLGFALGGNADILDYDDVSLVGGGLLGNDDRDRLQYDIHATASYQFSPGYALFGRAAYNRREFDLTPDRSGLNRNSHGYRLNGGVRFLVTRLLEGEVFAGFLQQKYSAPLADVSGADYGAALTWNPTPLFTFHLNAARNVVDTTLAGASASDEKSISLSVDYEFRRNIILQAGAGYVRSDYEGIAREDDSTTAHAGATYLINRYMSGKARYTYSHRSSSLPGQGYSDNVFRLGLDFQI